MDQTTPDPERARVERVILGRLAAFGRFAFTAPRPRAPRHADTWREVGPHASARECERRTRQMERQRAKAARRTAHA